MNVKRLAVVVAAALAAVGPAAARPVHYGGSITIGTSLTPNTSLDPTVGSDPGLRRMLPNFCLPLYTFASNHGAMELDPILAAAPPTVSADKLTYTIQLRHGIQFNDGTPFNAQAVVSSYQRYTTFPGSVHQSDFAGVTSATASGQYTVVYHLAQRNTAFNGNLLPLSPSAIAKEGSGFALDPICVGPFMVDSWTPGVQTTLVKSPYYYKRGAVYLDKIVFKVTANIQAALVDLQAGDVQVVQDSSVTPPTSPDVKTIKAVQTGWAGFVINMGNRGNGNPHSPVDSPLAKSPKLRQAFEEAVDRATDTRLTSFAIPSCTLVPADDNAWYAQTKVPCTPYDPKDAKQLVAASGYPTPITVHLQIIGNNPSALAEAQLLQSMEDAVGFNVVIDVLASAAYNAALDNGSFDVVVQAQQPNDPDPNSYIYPYLDSAGSRNDAGYSNPRLDYVLANALKATDPRARATDYRVAQQIVHADRPVIIIRESVSYGVFDSDLSGIQFSPLGYLLFANAQYK